MSSDKAPHEKFFEEFFKLSDIFNTEEMMYDLNKMLTGQLSKVDYRPDQVKNLMKYHRFVVRYLSKNDKDFEKLYKIFQEYMNDDDVQQMFINLWLNSNIYQLETQTTMRKFEAFFAQWAANHESFKTILSLQDVSKAVLQNGSDIFEQNIQSKNFNNLSQLVVTELSSATNTFENIDTFSSLEFLQTKQQKETLPEETQIDENYETYISNLQNQFIQFIKHYVFIPEAMFAGLFPENVKFKTLYKMQDEEIKTQMLQKKADKMNELYNNIVVYLERLEIYDLTGTQEDIFEAFTLYQKETGDEKQVLIHEETKDYVYILKTNDDKDSIKNFFYWDSELKKYVFIDSDKTWQQMSEEKIFFTIDQNNLQGLVSKKPQEQQPEEQQRVIITNEQIRNITSPPKREEKRKSLSATPEYSDEDGSFEEGTSVISPPDTDTSDTDIFDEKFEILSTIINNNDNTTENNSDDINDENNHNFELETQNHFEDLEEQSLPKSPNTTTPNIGSNYDEKNHTNDAQNNSVIEPEIENPENTLYKKLVEEIIKNNEKQQTLNEQNFQNQIYETPLTPNTFEEIYKNYNATKSYLILESKNDISNFIDEFEQYNADNILSKLNINDAFKLPKAIAKNHTIYNYEYNQLNTTIYYSTFNNASLVVSNQRERQRIKEYSEKLLSFIQLTSIVDKPEFLKDKMAKARKFIKEKNFRNYISQLKDFNFFGEKYMLTAKSITSYGLMMFPLLINDTKLFTFDFKQGTMSFQVPDTFVKIFVHLENGKIEATNVPPNMFSIVKSYMRDVMLFIQNNEVKPNKDLPTRTWTKIYIQTYTSFVDFTQHIDKMVLCNRSNRTLMFDHKFFVAMYKKGVFQEIFDEGINPILKIVKQDESLILQTMAFEYRIDTKSFNSKIVYSTKTAWSEQDRVERLSEAKNLYPILETDDDAKKIFDITTKKTKLRNQAYTSKDYPPNIIEHGLIEPNQFISKLQDKTKILYYLILLCFHPTYFAQI